MSQNLRYLLNAKFDCKTIDQIETLFRPFFHPATQVEASALGHGKEYEGFDHDDRAMRSIFQKQCGFNWNFREANSAPPVSS
jgi:hypothetical protein